MPEILVVVMIQLVQIIHGFSTIQLCNITPDVIESVVDFRDEVALYRLILDVHGILGVEALLENVRESIAASMQECPLTTHESGDKP